VNRKTGVGSVRDPVFSGLGDGENIPPPVQPEVSRYCADRKTEARSHQRSRGSVRSEGHPGQPLGSSRGGSPGPVQHPREWPVAHRLPVGTGWMPSRSRLWTIT